MNSPLIAKIRSLCRRIRLSIGLGVLTLLITATRFPALAKHLPAPTLAQRPTTAQVAPTTHTLLEQGRQLYQAGRFLEAATLWEQAKTRYVAEGLTLKQAISLNYLSEAYQALGQWPAAQDAITASLTLLQTQNQLNPDGIAILAQAWNTQGNLFLATGKTQAALETWEQAQTLYKKAGNQAGQLGSQLNQAQAWQALGSYRRAKTLLEQVNQHLQAQPDSLLKAEGLQSLGRALQLLGNLRGSKEILEQSWRLSQKLQASAQTTATLFSLGNVARDLQLDSVALAYYQEVAARAPNSLLEIQALLNQLSFYADTQQPDQAQRLVPRIQALLPNLPPSRPTIYARVNFAQSLLKLQPANAAIAELLTPALQQAKQLQDLNAESYALSQLGQLYEQLQQWPEAETFTQKALSTAQNIQATTLEARTAWQLGRIYQKQGKEQQAIVAYTEAYKSLQALRNDLIAVSSDVQFSFAQSVEPVYRELVSLLLREGAPEGSVYVGNAQTQENLKLARQVIEGLQLAEIENFFKEACLDAKPKQIDAIDAGAAVIYPIILPDRLEVILSLPGQPLRHYRTFLSAPELNRRLQQVYSSLYLGYSQTERLRSSQELYHWLIQPAEADLAANEIKTLVFILDGFLRNLPMAALHDGRQYLIEKYSIALSSGLQLLPATVKREQLRTVTAGLTESRQGFPPLPGVEVEVKEIATQVKSQVLLNQTFTRTALQKQIKSTGYPVVHLATHGQFSSNPDQTFLLTWDDRINVRDFDELLQMRAPSRVELLVLSACQTAAGDPKAALGLAGLALRSGAGSTLATLWSVSDQSTAQLMIEFYHQLAHSGTKLSKAEALRAAQLKLLKDPVYNHPYFWAAFVLVGNWL